MLHSTIYTVFTISMFSHKYLDIMTDESFVSYILTFIRACSCRRLRLSTCAGTEGLYFPGQLNYVGYMEWQKIELGSITAPKSLKLICSFNCIIHINR